MRNCSLGLVLMIMVIMSTSVFAQTTAPAVTIENKSCADLFPASDQEDSRIACEQQQACGRMNSGPERDQCQERAAKSAQYATSTDIEILKRRKNGGGTTTIVMPTKTATVGLQFALLGGFDWSSGALGNGTLRLQILKGIEVVEGDGDIVIIGSGVVGVSNTHDLNWVLGARLAAGYRFEFDADTRLAVLFEGGYAVYPNSPTLQGFGSDRWDFGSAVRFELWKLVVEGYGGFESFSSFVASGRDGESWILGLRAGGAISF